MSNKVINKASLTERIKIYEFLKNALIKVEGTVYWDYRDSWTDKSVAATIGAQLSTVISENSVQNVRREMFGALKPWTQAPEKPDVSEYENRIKNLEGQVSALDVAYRALQAQIDTINKSLEGKTIAISELQRKNHYLQNSLDTLHEELKKRDIDIGRLKLKAKFA